MNRLLREFRRGIAKLSLGESIKVFQRSSLDLEG